MGERNESGRGVRWVYEGDTRIKRGHSKGNKKQERVKQIRVRRAERGTLKGKE